MPYRCLTLLLQVLCQSKKSSKNTAPSHGLKQGHGSPLPIFFALLVKQLSVLLFFAMLAGKPINRNMQESIIFSR
jgi:hypothetical protein